MKKKLVSCILVVCMLLSMLPTMAWATEPVATDSNLTPVATPTDVTLNIANGSIVITDTGYTQGNAAEETPHTGDYVITQSVAGALAYYVHVNGGTHNITLDGVNLNGGIDDSDDTKDKGPFYIDGSANVTLTLDGENTLKSPTNVHSAALEVLRYSSVTIKVPDGQDDDDGTLTADTTAVNNAAAIGGGHQRNAGTVIIKSGTVNANARIGDYAKCAGIGPGAGSDMQKIEITGGVVNVTGNFPIGKERASNIVDELVISGGTVTSANGISANNYNITGGNIITTAELPPTDSNGRKLSKLYVYDDETDTEKRDALVEVTVNDTTWKAKTDSNGVITTYLGENETVTGGEKLPGGWLIGGTCSCNITTFDWGSTPSAKSVYDFEGINNDTFTVYVDLGVGTCDMPIHNVVGDVSCAIESVTLKNGTAVAEEYISNYASYDPETKMLTLKVAQSDYTVKLKATFGDEPLDNNAFEINVTIGDSVESINIAGGPVTVVAAGGDNENNKLVTYSQNGTELFTVKETDKVVIFGSYSYSTDNVNAIKIENCSPTIVLKDVTIETTGNSTSTNGGRKTGSIILISGTADNEVKLILSGTNTINRPDVDQSASISKRNCGIEVRNATLTIECETHEGSNCNDKNCSDKLMLNIGSPFGAGIGTKSFGYTGGNFFEGFTLNVEGGQISVLTTGGYRYGAAIGRGYVYVDGPENTMDPIAITIKGGYVKTSDPDSGIGIGANSGTENVSVTVEGGVVESISTINGRGADNGCAIKANSVTITNDAEIVVQGNVNAGSIALNDTAELVIQQKPSWTSSSVSDNPGGSINGTVTVNGSSSLTTAGGINGDLETSGNATVEINGNASANTSVAPSAEVGGVSGTVTVGAGSKVTVTEEIKDTVTVEGGATINDTELPEDMGTTTIPAGMVDEVKKDAETGAVTLPAGTAIENEDGAYTVLLDKGSVDSEGSLDSETPTATVKTPDGKPVVGNADGTFTIPAGSTVNGAEIPAGAGTVTVPTENLDEVKVDDAGNAALPAGTVIENADGTTTTYPDGASVAEEGTVDTEGTKVTENTNGSVTITDKDGNETTITPAVGEKVTVNSDGTVTLPKDSPVTITKGEETTTVTPAGESATVSPDGTVELPAGSEVQSGEGEPTVLPEGTGAVTLPTDKLDEVTSGDDGVVQLPAGTVVETEEGKTTLPDGGSVNTAGTVATEGTTITEKADGTVEITKDEETTTITPAEGEKVTVNNDGTMELPEGTVVKNADNTTTTIPAGGEMDADGAIASEGNIITENKDGSVTVADGENVTTIIPAEGKEVTVNTDGTMELPEGTVVKNPDNTTTTIPAGGEMAADGEIASEGNIITENKDGSVTVTDKDDNETTITPPTGEDVTVNADGTVEVPKGTVVKNPDNTTTTIPAGGEMAADGAITSEGNIITENKDGSVTVAAGENVTTITPDEGKDITVKPDGTMELPKGTVVKNADGTTTTLPDGGSVNTEGTVETEGTKITEDATTGTVEITKGGETTTITPPADGGSITVKPDGTVEVPAGSTVTKDGETTTLTQGGTVDKDGAVTETPVTPPVEDEDDKPTPQPPYSGYYPSYTPSVTPAAPSVDSSSLNNAALAVGSAIKDGSAEFTPVNGYTKDEVLQMQKDGKLRMGIEKKSGYGSVADKNLAEAAIKSAGGAVSGTSVMYFDITPVLKLDNGTVVAHVTDTEKAITITIELSAELTKAAKDGKDIAVVRVHDGKAEFLSCKLNAAKTKVTFSSADFSTYAVVALNKATSAKTFDAGVAMYVGMAVLAATGSAVVIGKKRK